MHELALMNSLVDAIAEQLHDPDPSAATRTRRVAVVRLEIGMLAGVALDPLRFAFEACAGGTLLEGAQLEILSIPGRARCKCCGCEHPTTSLLAPCPCGSFDRVLVSGNELRLKDVEVM